MTILAVGSSSIQLAPPPLSGVTFSTSLEHTPWVQSRWLYLNS